MNDNFIISTPNIYVEIPSDYKSLSISLVAVSSFDTQGVEREVKKSGVLHSIRNYFTGRGDSVFEAKSIYRMVGERLDLRTGVMKETLLYEVRLNWEYENKGSHGGDWREAMAGTHGMVLEEARKEKREIIQQLAERCSTIRMVGRFLKNPDETAVGLLGNEFEREVARVVYKFINK